MADAQIFQFPVIEERRIRLTVDVDEVTFARLVEASDGAHVDPNKLAASLLHDVLEDDAIARSVEHAEAQKRAH